MWTKHRVEKKPAFVKDQQLRKCLRYSPDWSPSGLADGMHPLDATSCAKNNSGAQRLDTQYRGTRYEWDLEGKDGHAFISYCPLKTSNASMPYLLERNLRERVGYDMHPPGTRECADEMHYDEMINEGKQAHTVPQEDCISCFSDRASLLHYTIVFHFHFQSSRPHLLITNVPILIARTTHMNPTIG